MPKYGVKDIDKGWGTLIKQVQYLKNHAVDIGIQAGEEAKDGFDMAALAAVHEFGAYINQRARTQNVYRKVDKNGNMKKGFVKKAKSNFMTRHQVKAKTIKIPSRPFMRRAFDTYLKEMNDYIQSVVERIYQKKLYAPQALGLIGQKYERLVKQKITEGPWKPNAPSTVRKKKSSRPLIDQGHLRRAIKYVIRRRGK